MSKLSKKIVNQVRKAGVKPTPKWQFIAKRGVVWFTLAVAILIGAMAISMIVFQIDNVEWDLAPRMAGGRPGLFLKTLPYFWAIIAGLLLTFVYFDFRKTKTGYRYSAPAVIGASLVISTILGVTIFSLEGPHRLEPVFEKIPQYKQINFDRRELWEVPEDGLLGGRVTEPIEEKTFYIEDFKGNSWHVTFVELKEPQQNLIQPEEMIKIIGEKVGDLEFEAEEIRPWIKKRIEVRPPR